MRPYIKLYLFFLLSGFFFLSGSKLNSQLMNETLAKIDNPNFFDYKRSYNQALEAAGGKNLPGWKQYKRWEYFWEPRVGKDGSFPDPQMIYDAFEYVTALNNNSKQGNRTLARKWNNLGPNLHTNISGHGRVNIVRLNPNNDNEIWAGSAGGGVWKSSNGGQSWINFPFTGILSMGVSDIALAPSNPNVVYVATGDANGSGSTQYSTYSVGILKTTDGGNTWNTTGYNQSIERRGLVARILVHPSNQNILIAGTSSGIKKSIDGGDTWYDTFQSIYFRDMEFLPGQPDKIYASTYSRSGGAAMYYSDDTGETWSFIESYPEANRIALAVSTANPNKVYAVLSKSADNGFHSFMVLNANPSNEFEVRAIYNNSPNILGWSLNGQGSGGQGFYDLAIAVNPQNENEIYTGGINIWKSTNGGSNWTLVTGGGGKPYIHFDHHDLLFNDDGSLFISANDGGLDKSTNRGASWQSISRGLEITQFYRLGISTISPTLLYAGAQDNGTSWHSNGNWGAASGGDGMEAIIDPTNDNRVYASSQRGSLKRRRLSDGRFLSMLTQSMTNENSAWVTPYILDPNNPNILYAGYTNIWRSRNYGSNGSWERISNFTSNRTFRSMAISPSDPSVIYAATTNVLNATYDGGLNWERILSSSSAITYVAVDPANPRRIFVTKSGFTEGNKVVEYDGEEWSNLSGNLPNVPVNCIVYQKDSPDRLYIGTDIGVYYSDYNSAYWLPFGEDMPHVSISELEINYSTRKLRVSTYGRGVWETDILECDADAPIIKVIGDLEFCKGESIVLEADKDYPNYLWSTGETTKSITVTEEGSFTLIIPESDECMPKSKVVHVSVLNVPNLRINIKGNNPLCDGESVTLSASFGFIGYQWSDGTTSRKLTTTEPGNYSVIATTSKGCTAESENYEVFIGSSPDKPTITFDNDELRASDAASYKWYRNGEIIPGAVSQVFRPIADGLYEVDVYNEDGCSSKSDPYPYNVSSVNDLDIESISIHPNPFEGYFNIEMNLLRPGNLIISVTNMIGEEVVSISEPMAGGMFSKRIDLAGSPKGIYLMIIKYGDNQIVEKLINR